MKRKRDKYIYLFIAIYFLSGTFYVTNDFKSLQIPMLIGSIMITIILSPVTSKIHYKKKAIDISYLLFTLSSFISSFYNQSIHGIVSSAGTLALWYFSSNTIENLEKKGKSIWSKTYEVILIPFLLLILYSLTRYGFRIERYRGVFYTSNSTGGCAATAIALICCFYLSDVTKKNIIGILKYKYYIPFLICSILLLSSTSRTSIIATIIIIILTGFIYLYYSQKTRKELFRIFIMGIIIVVLFSLIYYYTDIKSMINSVIVKAKIRNAQEDALAGRTDRWQMIIERARFLGNGDDRSVSSHNTFLGLLDQFGIPSTLFWIVFCLSGLINSIKIAFNRNYDDYMKFFPLFSFTMFIVLSLMEGMMMKTIMLMCVYSIPILNNKSIQL